MNETTLNLFIRRVEKELYTNIVPFWTRYSVDSAGGFVGRMSDDLVVDTKALKGLVLNARLLWSFSAICQFKANSECHSLAQRAFDYLIKYFWDTQYGGGFWMVNPDGSPAVTCKKSYGQSFFIYALAEFYRNTANPQALKKAQEIFDLLEKHFFDPAFPGYIEVCLRDWTLSEDQRLGDADMNEKKSMNNHLHLLEAFTNLYRVWKDPRVADRLRLLINLFCDTIICPDTAHLILFFDDTWKRKSDILSYGHDIETSWLLCEAGEVLGDAALLKKVEAISIRMAEVTCQQAIDPSGGLYYEKDQSGHLHTYKDFWCQAEAAIGFLNAYQLTRKQAFFDAALQMWEFIENYLTDKQYGEWFSRIGPDKKPVPNLPKVSEWKDPYHNTRCCIELIQRLRILKHK